MGLLMNTRIARAGGAPFTIGLVTGWLTQLAGGWWLNSGRGVATTMAILFVTAIGVCGRSDTPWFRAAAMVIGALAGMTVTLLWIGPGTLWPIVLFVAAALTCTAVYAGAWVARSVRHRR
jgi:hypothetical protein